MDATQTPIREHLEFDRMCATLEEFDHLPSIAAAAPEVERSERGDERELDQLILAGLVTPL